MIIPTGTRISFDGAILFETKENLEIKAGQTYGDVEGICTTAGDVGNNLAAGQVKEWLTYTTTTRKQRTHGNQRRRRRRGRRQLL